MYFYYIVLFWNLQITKVKLAEFGRPKPVEIWPVESLIKNYEAMKSYKITEKNEQHLNIFD